MKGEKQRLQMLGADGYLTKPVQLHLLKATIEKWLPPAAIHNEKQVLPSAQIRSVNMQPVDLHVLKALVGDDASTVEDFLETYLERIKIQRQELLISLINKDIINIANIAHMLKSSSRSVGALALAEQSGVLQKLCQTKDLAAIEESLNKTNGTLLEVESWLWNYLGEEGYDKRA
jgi:HPt (histidine-containing phosphotransfer) domain-containing protein